MADQVPTNKMCFRTLFLIAILFEALDVTIGVFHLREMSHVSNGQEPAGPSKNESELII